MKLPLWRRLLAATGLIYGLLNLITLIALPPPPAAGAPAQEIAAYYATHRIAFLITNYGAMLAVVFLLLFIGYLRNVAERADSEARPLSTLAFSAAVVLAASTLVFGGIGQTLPLRSVDVADLGIVRALSDIINFGFTTNFISATLMIGAASLLILRTGVIARWVGVLGLVIAVVQLLGSLSLVITSGFLAAGGPFTILGFVGLMLWMPVASIVMIVKVGSRSQQIASSAALGQVS